MLLSKNVIYQGYHDSYEYHGNTEIDRIRKKDDEIIEHDWLIFNSVDEAMEFFHDKCRHSNGYYN